MSDIRITQEQIDRLLDQSETQEAIFWEKELVVSYKLPSGFVISGRSAVVDPNIFVLEIGRQVARDEVSSKLWQLEGYRLHLEVFGQEKSSSESASF